MPDSLIIAQQLKTALLDRDFDQFDLLILQWGQHVMAAMSTAQDETSRRRIFDEALAVAGENSYLAKAVRSQIASELDGNSCSFLYRGTDLEQSCWHVEA